jgi:hypothetical protein
MDPGTIGGFVAAAGGASSAVKNVIEAITTVRHEVKGNKKAEDRLAETLDLVAELRSRLFDLQEKALNLQQEYAGLLRENAQLREDIRSKETGAAEGQKYQRKQVGKAVVLVRENEPGIYYCLACSESKDKKIGLNEHSGLIRQTLGFSHFCPLCEANYPIE